MKVEDYQADADRTAVHDVVYDDTDETSTTTWIAAALKAAGHDPTQFLARERLVSAALGMAGEAGEVADYIKKALHQGHKIDRVKVLLECGDVLWYLTQVASALDESLDTIMVMNVDKRRDRYPTGFTIEASVKRKEET